MPPKRRQVTWNDLNAKVSAKRTRADGMNRGKTSVAPQEIVVQKLSSEPDNKQTYRPGTAIGSLVSQSSDVEVEPTRKLL